MVAGDFNLHHREWNPEGYLREDKDAEGLLDQLTSRGFLRSSEKGVPTFLPPRGSPTTIDLVFTNGPAAELLLRCKTLFSSKEEYSSDHLPISIDIDAHHAAPDPNPRYNINKADWEKMEEILTEEVDKVDWESALESKEKMNERLEELEDIFKEVIDESVPLVEVTRYTKRWWTEELNKSKAEVSKARRNWKKSKSGVDEEETAKLREKHSKRKNEFKREVEHQKSKHFWEWLGDLDEESLWRAARYCKREDRSRTVPPLRKADGSFADLHQQQAEEFINAFNTTSDSVDLSDINNSHAYPNPLPDQPLVIEEFDRFIENVSLKSAPGEDNISYLVMSKMWHIIRLPLFLICKAAHKFGCYPKSWKKFLTVILKKPSKSDYSIANSYRPIALLKCLGKVFDGVLANRIHFLAEKHGMWASTHFGGRSGRATTDGLLFVTERIRHGWRAGRFTASAFLDIKGAFPSVIHSRLIHNLRNSRIPRALVNLIQDWLSDRETRLSFNGSISDPFPRTNGIDQGSPLSPPLFLFYNSPLLCAIPTTIRNSASGFIDDVMISCQGESVEEAREELEKELEKATAWAATHGAVFEFTKTKYVIFTRNNSKFMDETPLKFGGSRIFRSESAKYLGVVLDRQLRFHEHCAQAERKGRQALGALASIVRTIKGLKADQFRLLFTSCVCPKMDYGAVLWHKFNGPSMVTKRLTLIQRTAQRKILGAFRTTPASALDYDSGLPSTQQRLDTSAANSALRLLTLPNNNPAGVLARRAMHRGIPTRHQTPLQIIFHSEALEHLYQDGYPRPVEIIQPRLFPPWYQHPLDVQTDFPEKEDAVEIHNKIVAEERGPQFLHVYSDGSLVPLKEEEEERPRGGVAAAAYSPETGDEASVKMGSPDSYTVFEAEVKGVKLATELICAHPPFTNYFSKFPSPNRQALRQRFNRSTGDYDCPKAKLITIWLDSQAALQALAKTPARTSGQYLLADVLNSSSAVLNCLPLNSKIRLRWVPGHSGVEGNERVDDIARLTANSRVSVPASSRSISSSKTETKSCLSSVTNPPIKDTLHHIVRRGLGQPETFEMLRSLPRHMCSIFFQLRSGHSPLQGYLHRFRITDSPICQHCGESAETVDHYLFVCPAWEDSRDILRNLCCGAEQPFEFPSDLLSNPTVTKFTTQFISSTDRFTRGSYTRQQVFDQSASREGDTEEGVGMGGTGGT